MHFIKFLCYCIKKKILQFINPSEYLMWALFRPQRLTSHAGCALEHPAEQTVDWPMIEVPIKCIKSIQRVYLLVIPIIIY